SSGPEGPTGRGAHHDRSAADRRRRRPAGAGRHGRRAPPAGLARADPGVARRTGDHPRAGGLPQRGALTVSERGVGEAVDRDLVQQVAIDLDVRGRIAGDAERAEHALVLALGVRTPDAVDVQAGTLESVAGGLDEVRRLL